MRQISNTNNYEKDLYKWAKTQAILLRRGDFSKIDLEHVIEEIEGLAKSERKALKNQMIRLLLHLLKYEFQPQKRGKSWIQSIGNSRLSIEGILEDNPSLKRELLKIFQESYPYARKKAHIETGLDIKVFPIECPWSLKEVLGQ